MARSSEVSRSALRIAGAALVLALTACTVDVPAQPVATARPVSSQEAELLATTRFLNFDQGGVRFSTQLPVDGSALTLTGWVDHAAHVGYAAVTGDFPAQAMLWTGDTVGIRASEPDGEGLPVLPIPALDDLAWQSRALDAAASDLDRMLTVLLGLGADRPDNPLLLQQSGALWLRDDEVGGEPVTVFAAPPSDEPIAAGTTVSADTSPLRLWVGADGRLRQAELRISGEWARIALDPSAEIPQLELPGS
ncbi:hypothetical protein [Salinibacterium sp. ZJ70]|uniref:hypothetical protein n=1 Tax=Salinibacterium sp. ZJ70 TaxID=2708084 RepID=UPI001420F61F|nr:hypothetical protein [Salinibacterium sp. ZJ70]